MNDAFRRRTFLYLLQQANCNDCNKTINVMNYVASALVAQLTYPSPEGKTAPPHPYKVVSRE